jgi:thioredoxin 1
VQEVTDASFEELVLKAELPTLVDFWAEWCGPCRMIAPVVAELSEAYDGQMQVLKMDVDANPQTPGRLGIMGIPTLILFKDGQESERIVGFRPREALEDLLAPHLS